MRDQAPVMIAGDFIDLFRANVFGLNYDPARSVCLVFIFDLVGYEESIFLKNTFETLIIYLFVCFCIDISH